MTDMNNASSVQRLDLTCDAPAKAAPTLKIAGRASLPPFMAMDVMAKAAAMEQAGQDVLHLEIGQPSSSAPKAVLAAMPEILSAQRNHGYSIALGLPALRARISKHYQDWYGLDVPIERIAVTVGSSTGFALSFMAAFDAGDRIALPNPGYPAYRNLMLGMGLEPVMLPAGVEEGWMPSLKAMEKMDRMPDGLIIASPHNPTGVIMDARTLREICAFCRANQVRLISDEIYHGLSYQGRAQSALHFTQDAFIMNSMSKYFSMTGWRIGWMVVPEQMTGAVERLAQNLYISAPTPNQLAAIHAFDCHDELEQHCQRYQQNREILLQGLPAAFLGQAAPCDGAFYLYCDISALSHDSIAFAAELLDKTGVATTPGVDFDQENGHRYIRISFAGDTDTIKEAVKRISAFVEARLTEVA